MTREKMYEKYHDVLMAMYEKTGDDTSVCFDKLVYAYKNRGVEGADVYEGIPEDFDWDAFGEDYAVMVG